jgi:hypothetical protein
MGRARVSELELKREGKDMSSAGRNGRSYRD